jgi:hypothetical protein
MASGPNKAFIFFAQNFRVLKRSGDSKKLEAFLASDQYLKHFAALTSSERMRVHALWHEALTAIKERATKQKPLPRYNPSKGWRSWTPERIAQLKAAEAKYGTDEGIARAMGISLDAATRARYRHIGPRPVFRFGADTTARKQAA